MTIAHFPGTDCQDAAAVPLAAEMINFARQAQSFQTRELLQRIVSGEQQRIKEEQMLWRIGGALLGACLGLSDGFQASDVFLGIGFSSLAGMGHEVMTHEQRRFLEGCHSLWTVGANSPIELMARLGPARSRILFYGETWSAPVVLAHHQGARGDTLLPLGLAQQHAAGFHQQQSLEVLQRYFSGEELQLLACQLYPDAASAIQVSRVVPISAEQARQVDPYADAFLSDAEPMLIETGELREVGYRVPIPVNSDF